MARQRDEPEFDFDQDIVDIIPERFDRDPDSREAGRGYRRNLLMTLGLGVAVIACVGAVILYFFSGNSNTGAKGGVPIVKADQGPLKTRPNDRGGMEVPNQDKLVYERMGTTASDPKVERLLPPPETPQAPPVRPMQAAPTPLPAQPPAPIPPAAVQRNEPPPPAAIPKAPVAVTPVGPTTTPPKPAAAAPQVTMVPMTPAKPAAPPMSAPKGGNFVVQLAALKSQADAEKTWTQLSKQNADLLSSLKSDITQVDLGQKGIFFRLRAGPMDEASAKNLCGQLAQRKVGCLVAKK
jgi:cell division septation protein DedD